MKYLVVLVTTTVIAVGVLVANSGAQTQPLGPRTIVVKERDKGSKFTFVDAARPFTDPKRPKPSMGDYFVFHTPLVNPTNNARVGELDAKCVIVKPGKHEVDLCEGSVTLGDGDLFLSARVVGEGDVTGAITGGTGNYANARGTFTSKGDPATDTFTFTQ